MRVKLSFTTPEFAIAYIQPKQIMQQHQFHPRAGTLRVVGTAGSVVSAVTTERAGAVIRVAKRKLP